MNKFKEQKIETFKLTDEEKVIAKEHYDSFIKDLKESSFYTKSPNKKSYQFNMNFHKNDLIVMDELASLLSVKRSEIIGTLVSNWVIELFLKMPHADSPAILKHVESKITEEHTHHYEGKTWEWKLSTLAQEYEYAQYNDQEIKHSLITRDMKK
ncbi:hypothetical protein AB4347_02035 [Vibrio breoganii]|uniref:hypothetical protein n=1 Tax=Vibrionaceae TaxID=641 RepID=UPI000C83BB50|nr:hypothetical protein [Vibrio breoganii]PMG94198.1 hypothetical protein BCU80_07120 [Vibrio breoganii]PMK23235.1 hypothetical protein BCU06_04285 [Vibrio breoganii]PMK55653.1 hypothetical protein BCT98_10285 [Vibrio breoganii]PMK67132.1 hypothetical protein BCT94_17610 [Vibrio breoganii]PML25779.1 hypothetical protein BCT82_11185 [Vibrio breoganii]